MYSKRDPSRDPKKRGTLRRYKDGGTILNNPAEIALNEVRNRYGIDGEGNRNDPALLLSVGTGIRYDTPFAAMNSGAYAQSQRADMPLLQSIRERLAIAKHILMRYTEGENTHRTIRRNIVDAEHLWYKRLNVDIGLGDMDLADWRRGHWKDSKSHASEEKLHPGHSGSHIKEGGKNLGNSRSHGNDGEVHSERPHSHVNEGDMHSGGATLTEIENATRNYLTRDTLHKDNEIEWYLLPKEMLDHTAERMVRHRIERRRGVDRDKGSERSWQTYQGRWSSGRKAEPWDNDSRDWPKSPASSVEDLKIKGKRAGST